MGEGRLCGLDLSLVHDQAAELFRVKVAEPCVDVQDATVFLTVAVLVDVNYLDDVYHALPPGIEPRSAS